MFVRYEPTIKSLANIVQYTITAIVLKETSVITRPNLYGSNPENEISA